MKGTPVNYVVKIIDCTEKSTSFPVSYLRKSMKTAKGGTFIFPEREAVGDVKPDEVIGVLVPPKSAPTPRLEQFIKFENSLTEYNHRQINP